MGPVDCGDEPANIDKRKLSRGAVVQKHMFIEDKSCQNGTSPKLINKRTDSYRDIQSGRQGDKPTYVIVWNIKPLHAHNDSNRAQIEQSKVESSIQ